MRFLVLGGTAWLGHRIAATALERGHDVTCLARGSAVPDGAELVVADRDDPRELPLPAGARWDVVVDVARQPGHVRRAVRELRSRSGRYVFVSTGNVYASQSDEGADETAELLPALVADSFTDPDHYGPAKVACENAVLAAFGSGRSLIARAGLIGGPGDPTGRTDYWPRRFARETAGDSISGGPVLVPDAPELPTALIDVRDLADWLVRAAEAGTAGVFNAGGTPVPFPAHLDAARAAARAVTRSTAPTVVAAERWLLDRGVSEWAGPRSLPLWVSDRSWYGMNARSSAAARAAGLTVRPLEDTLRDAALAHESDSPFPGGAGLTPAHEHDLVVELETARESPPAAPQ
ncbi:oxidoreductase [Marisediminicola sp. LYQ134]|uniref:oxidoreductase n=1 Tax=Marisediminicola sp. LYQ134 TaxID=3391061 RepID=UPI003982FEC4